MVRVILGARREEPRRARWSIFAPGTIAGAHDVLQAGLALRDRRDAGGLSDHGLATARGRLLARLSRLIDNPPPLDDAERFAAHLASEFPAIFTFLWAPSVDATN